MRSAGDRVVRRRASGRVVVTALTVVVVLVLASCSSSSPATPATTRSGVTTSTTDASGSGSSPTSSEATVAEDAFLAGYPLVTTERIMQLFAGLAGVNQLLHAPQLSTVKSRLIVGPNQDTLYALAVLDLRAGPQALTVPRIEGRYYTFQFIDAWMDTVGYVGTRATGGRAGTWVVVPPGFKGTLPAGDHRISSPTEQLVMLGRIAAVQGPDVARAFAVSQSVQLQPLAVLEHAAAPPAAPPMSKPAGPPQTVGANGLGYYDELGAALAVNPPVTAQQETAFVAAATVGIGAGQMPSTSATRAQRALLTRAVTDGVASLRSTAGLHGTVIDGWLVNLHLGDPHAQLSLHDKAVIARHFWGPNVAAEAVYPSAATASDGRPLTGAKDYVIHLAADNLPPVKAFWSYTVYGPDSFFIANPINRVSINAHTAGLVRGADGSLDIYLSHTAPAGHEANWLPTPSGPFRLVLRLYLPGPAILNGTYRYPPVTVVP